MIRPSVSRYRRRAIVVLVVLGAAVAGGRWAVSVRPRAEALRAVRERLNADRKRLAETRAQLLRLGSEGIIERNRALRAEVSRREALAPVGTLESAGTDVRERFAALASRYGVHAPSFEAMPVQKIGEIRFGGLRIRATGGYHAIGTWIAEGVSDRRLLDVGQARLRAVPDSLLKHLRFAAPPTPPAGSPRVPDGALELAGAAPLDAVVEFVVRWYALDEAAEAGSAEGAE